MRGRFRLRAWRCADAHHRRSRAGNGHSRRWTRWVAYGGGRSGRHHCRMLSGQKKAEGEGCQQGGVDSRTSRQAVRHGSAQGRVAKAPCPTATNFLFGGLFPPGRQEPVRFISRPLYKRRRPDFTPVGGCGPIAACADLRAKDNPATTGLDESHRRTPRPTRQSAITAPPLRLRLACLRRFRSMECRLRRHHATCPIGGGPAPDHGRDPHRRAGSITWAEQIFRRGPADRCRHSEASHLGPDRVPVLPQSCNRRKEAGLVSSTRGWAALCCRSNNPDAIVRQSSTRACGRSDRHCRWWRRAAMAGLWRPTSCRPGGGSPEYLAKLHPGENRENGAGGRSRGERV